MHHHPYILGVLAQDRRLRFLAEADAGRARRRRGATSHRVWRSPPVRRPERRNRPEVTPLR